MLTIGQRIKEAREAKGWTQIELGKRIGHGKQSISNMECDRYPPPNRTLMALERVLRTKLVK